MCFPINLLHSFELSHTQALLWHGCELGSAKTEPRLFLLCRAQHLNKGDKNRTRHQSGCARLPAPPESEKAGSTTSSNSAACRGLVQSSTVFTLWLHYSNPVSSSVPDSLWVLSSASFSAMDSPVHHIFPSGMKVYTALCSPCTLKQLLAQVLSKRHTEP